jgi:hypothetical protein
MLAQMSSARTHQFSLALKKKSCKYHCIQFNLIYLYLLLIQLQKTTEKNIICKLEINA